MRRRPAVVHALHLAHRASDRRLRGHLGFVGALALRLHRADAPRADPAERPALATLVEEHAGDLPLAVDERTEDLCARDLRLSKLPLLVALAAGVHDAVEPRSSPAQSGPCLRSRRRRHRLACMRFRGGMWMTAPGR